MQGTGDIRHARILLALGEVNEAEREVLLVLEQHEGERDALRLLAKIKHMRGELTAAVTCWSQIHASVAPEAAARQHIAVLLQMARDPVRHAGEFLAMGQPVRKPLAHL